MNEANQDNLDVLITRVIDGRAGAAEWAELETLAAANSKVWREVALAQKDAAALSGAVGRCVTVAERVVLPEVVVRGEAGVKRRVRNIGAWGGWATAAAVALAFVASRPAAPRAGTGQEAGLVSLPGLLDRYIDQGKKEGAVIGELPDQVLLNSEPTADGKYEVVFVRQIVEKTTVPYLYRMSVDEAGRGQPVRVQINMVGSKSPT